MTVAILCLGTELTRGELVNTNAAWLAETLTLLGFEVTAIETTDDHRSRIERVLRRLGAEHELVVCTGGLGPTTDDLTTESVAATLGVPLERDPDSYEAIRRRMERFGRTMAASNAKQADFPRGATILPNSTGTAPGFGVEIGGALAFFLPGVPREMKAMFNEHVAARLSRLAKAGVHQIRLKTYGMAESTVNDRLEGVEAAYGVTLGYRAHFPEIEVKVQARGTDAQETDARARSAADEVRERLGIDIVYGEGDAALPEEVGKLLVERGLMLGLAESCTGGLVAELVTERSGASAFFAGGIVSYSNELKERLLGVPRPLLEEHGAVSAPVARAMAEGALGALGANVTLALTGVAGPTGGTAEKPVGLVHYAVATRERTVDEKRLFPGTRRQVQLVAAFAGLSLVRKILLGRVG